MTRPRLSLVRLIWGQCVLSICSVLTWRVKIKSIGAQPGFESTDFSKRQLYVPRFQMVKKNNVRELNELFEIMGYVYERNTTWCTEAFNTLVLSRWVTLDDHWHNRNIETLVERYVVLFVQAMFTVHVFPSCDFANENLTRIAPDLMHRVADIAHLLIVIATVWLARHASNVTLTWERYIQSWH